MSFITSMTGTYNPATEKVVPKDSVVLDLDPTIVTEGLGAKRNEVQLLVDMLRESADEFFDRQASALARKVADQIEAQTKPPRIPEPGRYGVVHDANGDEWTRAGGARESSYEWVNLDTGASDDWERIKNPVLIRPGV